MKLTPQRKRLLLFGTAGALVVLIFVLGRRGAAAAPSVSASPSGDIGTAGALDGGGLGALPDTPPAEPPPLLEPVVFNNGRSVYDPNTGKEFDAPPDPASPAAAGQPAKKHKPKHKPAAKRGTKAGTHPKHKHVAAPAPHRGLPAGWRDRLLPTPTEHARHAASPHQAAKGAKPRGIPSVDPGFKHERKKRHPVPPVLHHPPHRGRRAA